MFFSTKPIGPKSRPFSCDLRRWYNFCQLTGANSNDSNKQQAGKNEHVSIENDLLLISVVLQNVLVVPIILFMYISGCFYNKTIQYIGYIHIHIHIHIYIIYIYTEYVCIYIYIQSMVLVSSNYYLLNFQSHLPRNSPCQVPAVNLANFVSGTKSGGKLHRLMLKKFIRFFFLMRMLFFT